MAFLVSGALRGASTPTVAALWQSTSQSQIPRIRTGLLSSRLFMHSSIPGTFGSNGSQWPGARSPERSVRTSSTNQTSLYSNPSPTQYISGRKEDSSLPIDPFRTIFVSPVTLGSFQMRQEDVLPQEQSDYSYKAFDATEIALSSTLLEPNTTITNQKLDLMNRNARRGKAANRYKRPCSRQRRRARKRAIGNHRR